MREGKEGVRRECWSAIASKLGRLNDEQKTKGEEIIRI